MDKKEAKATLDQHAPGWVKADSAAHHIKGTVDPKFRFKCLAALAAHNAAGPDKITETKAKAKPKAKPKTTTTKKEG
tara:strand:+ start:1780 stop:2010 length:231 start_codon:yes stop_codon:yes gene_type:complete